MVRAYLALLLDRRPLRDLPVSAAIAKAGTYFIIGLVLALLWSSVARAQTATPTPTTPPTPTPYPTVTPVGTVEVTPTPDASGSTIVWGCWLNPNSAAACTWGDYFETQPAYDFKEASGTTAYYTPGPGASDYQWLVFSPPANTRAVVATCTSRTTATIWKRGGLTSPSAQAHNRVDKLSSVSLHNSLGLYNLGSEGPYNFNTSLSVDQSTGDWFGFYEPTATFTWTLAANLDVWPYADTLPNNYANAVNYARFGSRVQLQGGPAYAGAYAYAQAACQIDKIIRIDGTEYQPGTPQAGVTPAPGSTPLPGGEPWPTPIYWTPGNPALIMTGTLGIAPVGSTCHSMLPTFTAGGVTVFGYTVPELSVPEVEVCLEEHTLNLNFLGWNFGTLVVAVAALGMGGALYGLLKNG